MICKVEKCENKAVSHGLCGKHYMRLRRTGCAHTVRPPGVPGVARKHPLYSAWGGMVNRCHNPNNSSYGRYGKVGVTVCNRWRFGEGEQKGFECFLSDMGERPIGSTLDRIDPNGPYNRANCRWADAKQQRANLSERGFQDAAIKGSKAKRTRQYTEAGEQLYTQILAKKTSINALSTSIGFCASYLFSVLVGSKAASKRLLSALSAKGYDVRMMTDAANVLNFTKARKVQ